MGIFNRRRAQEPPVETLLTEQPEGGALRLGEINPALIRPVIGKDEVREATQTLMRYKSGKANLDRRTVENEEWWKLRHWRYIKEQGTTTLETKSAWLVNVILNKHADAMDAVPEANCLPRAADDEQEAKTLSSVVPVILQQNDFEETWDAVWWKKLKVGVGFYGVFWDPKKLNGLGDVSIQYIDPLNLFWEPGITDLQDSANIFLVTLVDNEVLKKAYPEIADKIKGSNFQTARYLYDDNVDTTDKSAVIDWYYKKQQGGRTVLHFAKFVGESVLYATENEAESPEGTLDAAEGQPPAETSVSERGLYDHGLYPFFADVLFPEEGTPAGYGYIDICKDAQRQIDLMNNAIVANCIAAATPRWLKRGDDGVNEEEYADWTKPFVHVQGSIEENNLRQIEINPLSGNYITILQTKIDELKETSGNRDVNTGGAPSGVTAASAIAALQEQSGKLSRDQVQGSYRCFRQIVYCVIELIRQFYDAPRTFRITGGDQMTFVQVDNRGLQPVPQMSTAGVPAEPRLPVFDIEVTAQKQASYSKIAYNELALQLYGQGFFNPQMADQALAALDMMDFKGKDKVVAKIRENGGLYQMVQMLMQQVAMLQGQQTQPTGGPEPMPSGGQDRKPLQETDAQGQPMNNNRIAEKAKARAQEATQPR